MTDTLTATVEHGAEITSANDVSLGDTVVFSYSGSTQLFTGTVYGRYRRNATSGVGVDGSEPAPWTMVWVGSPDMPRDSHPWASRFYRVNGDTRYEFAPNVEHDTFGVWVEPGTSDGDSRLYRPATAVAEDSVSAIAAAAHRAEVERLTAQIDSLRTEVRVAHDVVGRIGEALKDTAEQSEWCGEFDRRARELVDSLPSAGGFASTFQEAVARQHDYTIRFFGTYSVTADSADDARELFHEMDHGDLDGDVEIDYVESDD